MAARKKTTEEKDDQQAVTMTTEQAVPDQEEGHVEDTREQTPGTVETPEAAPSVLERSKDDCAPQEAGQPRSGSEAFSAQNASDSECRTGTPAEGRHAMAFPLASEASLTEMDSRACDRASSGLSSLPVLADRHRVPSWQQAALCRFMGWADGKMLTDDEYRAALAGLTARHLGGGRRK
ncbi:hypothetical protein [Desulfovibrio sp. SGI.169]|uniref:hypothetical protein n=1 Tax=Desulfovibrio sp. SGI.169 TaxID=3420561 RepID=UPI003D04BC9E